jgi:hypothetical protein
MPISTVPYRTRPYQDLTGQRFNRLIAVRYDSLRHFSKAKPQELWEFRCDCGRTTLALKGNVRSGHTTSCGCRLREVQQNGQLKHGDGRRGKQSHLYIVWCGMKQRCEEVTNKRYADWGGRGIKILWRSYEEFKLDMEPTYKAGLQIDRKDNEGHYCKENCKWSTVKEQALNRRSNIRLTLNGKMQSISVWAEELGIGRATLERRHHVGWTDQETLTTPINGTVPFVTFNGKTQSLRSLCLELGVDYKRTHSRIKRSGLSLEKALTRPHYSRTR